MKCNVSFLVQRVFFVTVLQPAKVSEIESTIIIALLWSLCVEEVIRRRGRGKHIL